MKEKLTQTCILRFKSNNRNLRRWYIHTGGGGENMEPKRLAEEDEVVEESLGPKRWSKFMVDEEESPACFFLVSIYMYVYRVVIPNKLRWYCQPTKKTSTMWMGIPLRLERESETKKEGSDKIWSQTKQIE